MSTAAERASVAGLRVAFCPGSVSGARIENVMQREADARGVDVAVVREGYLRPVSLRSCVPPEDVASLAMYLASPAGALISGQVIGVDGHTETLQAWQKE